MADPHPGTSARPHGGRGPVLRAVGLADLLHAVTRHRALLAGGLVAAAVATGLGAVAPAREPVTAVLTAARDLPGGAALDPDDLVAAPLPRHLVPAGALLDAGEVAGRLLAAPVRRGEPLTDVRLLGSALLGDGTEVAVPVRFAEPAVAAVLRPGDRIDVLAAAPDGGTAARVVAADVPVLSVPSLADDPGEGALVVLAAAPAVAARLAAAAVTDRLSPAVRGR